MGGLVSSLLLLLAYYVLCFHLEVSWKWTVGLQTGTVEKNYLAPLASVSLSLRKETTLSVTVFPFVILRLVYSLVYSLPRPFLLLLPPKTFPLLLAILSTLSLFLCPTRSDESEFEEESLPGGVGGCAGGNGW